MVTIITPGVPKFISVTVLSGQTSGSKVHNMGSTPTVSKPNPNVIDGASATCYASADATNVTVTTEVPTSQDVIFTVLCMIT